MKTPHTHSPKHKSRSVWRYLRYHVRLVPKPAPLWLKDLTSIVMWWIVAALVITAVYPHVQSWIFIPVIFSAVLVLLRQIYRIPFIGEGWKDLFGDRKLWDWMQLLIVPVMLGFLSLNLKSSYESNQADIAIQKNREETLSRYLDTIMELSRDFNLVKNSSHDLHQLKRVDAQEPYLTWIYRGYPNILNSRMVCNPHEDTGPILARTRTLAALESLSELKNKEQYNTVKFLIIDVLFQAGFIDQVHAVVSLQKANLTSADMSGKYLPETCFDSVIFNKSNLEGAVFKNSKVIRSSFLSANLRRVVFESSDLRGSSFKGANLQGSNLMCTNLVWTKDKPTVFTNSDLRGANLTDAIIDDVHIFDGTIINLYKIVPKEKHWIVNIVCNYLDGVLKTEHIDLCHSETRRTLEPTVLPERVLVRNVNDSMNPTFVKLNKKCSNIKDGSKVTVRVMGETFNSSNNEQDVCYLYLDRGNLPSVSSIAFTKKCK